ncbi:unnamed protein product [Rangifer tarandus platyrhynchus]|uniref:Uncharacterized protein n=1 Tax=Rangifer tarandus platyrhynchus TaxID=3082113 RepID=A0ACB1KHH0_RANTA
MHMFLVGVQSHLFIYVSSVAFALGSWASPGGSDGKESACNAGDSSLIPGWGRSPGEGNGYHTSVHVWRIPMDRGAWWATVHSLSVLLFFFLNLSKFLSFSRAVSVDCQLDPLCRSNTLS